MKLSEQFSYRLNKIRTYYSSYLVLVSEYPYLKRLVFHLSILAASIIFLFLSNIPLVYRLGPIIDWLQFMAVIGLFYGILAGSAPYLKLDISSQTYQTVIKTQQKKLNQHSRPGRDLAIGVFSIVTSFMAMAIYLAVFDTTTSSQDTFFITFSLILLLTGIYFFFKSLRLISLLKWLYRTVIQIFSFIWLRNLINAFSNSTIIISFDRRNRVERLQDMIATNIKETINPTEAVYETLRKLHHEDYLILSVNRKPKQSVKFHKMEGHIGLELLLTRTETNKQKLNEAIKVIESNKVLKGFWIGRVQLNPDSFYYLSPQINANKTITGNLITVICKSNLIQASQLGLALLSQVYSWDEKKELEYTINTLDDSWWNKL